MNVPKLHLFQTLRDSRIWLEKEFMKANCEKLKNDLFKFNVMSWLHVEVQPENEEFIMFNI